MLHTLSRHIFGSTFQLIIEPSEVTEINFFPSLSDSLSELKVRLFMGLPRLARVSLIEESPSRNDRVITPLSLPEANILPSGLKARLLTLFVYIVRVNESLERVLPGLPILIVPFSHPKASVLPSALTARLFMRVVVVSGTVLGS
jgi:hypothetical protein